MKCATVKIDITPQVPVKLCGYVNTIRTTSYTEKAHAPIYATACLMQQDERQLLWITLDVLSIKKELVSDLKEAIASTHGIASEDIILQAIHTHSGPSGFSVDAMGKEYERNEEYRGFVKEQLLANLPYVFKNQMNCIVKFGETTIHGYYDNRNDPNAYFDDEIKVIKFVDEEGKAFAGFVNLSIHSTVLGPNNMEISYDLLGSIREELSKKWGFYPMMMLGSAADVSNRHYRQGDDFRELNRVSEGIAKQILSISNYQVVNTQPWHKDIFMYELNYDNQLFYPMYKEELTRIENELKQGCDTTKEKLNLSSKDKLLTKLTLKHIHKQIECVCLDFGNLRILCFPGELTSTFAKQLKHVNDHKQTLMATCVNDHHGYFLEKELYGTCYESIATLIPKGITETLLDHWKVKL